MGKCRFNFCCYNNETKMIYQKYNFVGSYNYASGNRRNSMVLGELGKLIATEKSSVINAVTDAGIRVPNKISNRALVSLIIANKSNRLLIENLSVLIFASASLSDGYSNVVDGEKGKLFKKIGEWFKQGKARRQARRQARKGKSGGVGSKLGGFLKDNQDQIIDVGGTLIDGLGNNRQAQNTMMQNTRNRYRNTGNNNTPSFFEKNKTAIIIGGVSVLILGAILIVKRKR